MADPGLATTISRRVSDDLAERLSERTSEHWRVEVIEETLPLGPDGTIDLSDYAPQILKQYDWDYVLYLTDLSVFSDRQPILCSAVAQSRGALVVLPALGALRMRAKVLELVVNLLPVLSGSSEEINLSDIAQDIGRRAEVQENTADQSVIVLRGRSNQLRMLSGMVRGNRPGRLPGALTGFITAGAASGAFGIFYSSIWTLAEALPPLRLLLIAAVVIALLTAWLIFHNGLWNTRDDRGMPSPARLDNAATVITVGVGVSLTYLVLFLGLFVMGLIVIDIGFLTAQIQQPAGLHNYLELSWLAASLGTMAGALGSNFDSNETIRRATYSRRWHERRKMFDTYNDRDS